MTDTTLLTGEGDTAPAAGGETEVANEIAKEVEQTTEGEITEEQAEASTEGDSEEAEKEEDKPQGAPETYEDFTVPEGVELDTELLGEFQVLGKELNLPQEQAQKVVDLGARMSQKWAERQQENVIALRKEWADATQADKDIGGDRLPETLSVAKRAIDTFGSPELRELLNATGLGNHPEVIRAFAKAGKAISEDNLVPAASTAGASRSAAKTLYPDHS